ncbi:NAD(P)-dependent oxidoreductase [Xanthobacter autotrophicus]|uniref:NAD-dependent epimerase/dehydratase family protein n=1 Tax=Xanthobacter autotrophicus TaxID=280 RepID=UPI001E4CC454|nr:NAD(P)-dependent oxidoreductase [Xanthobacter autotrophicus]UDQ90248.1 NAD(P)-dependent oxidoreductase [Xanthobacter autotrophicus]
MTVMITGGSGFVGLNITSALLARGESVVLFGPAAPPPAAAAHLAGLPGRLTVVPGDVCERAALMDALKAHAVDRLIHGAAITAGIDREARAARTIAEVNLGGTIDVLEAAIACGIRRVVQLGTGSVYGPVPADVEALDESFPPVPESLYGITKYAAERVAVRYRRTRGLEVVVGRLGVVFGRWEYDTGVRDTLSVPLQLLHRAAAGETAVFRPGLPDDWVYAADIAGAVSALLDAPAPRHEVYHLATGRRWSLRDWCDRLTAALPGFTYEMTDDAARLNVGTAAPLARPPFRVDRLADDIGFRARFGAAEAFEDYLAWFRETSAAA